LNGRGASSAGAAPCSTMADTAARQLTASVLNVDPFSCQELGLARLVARHQLSLAADHPPPRKTLRAGQHVSHRSGAPGVAS
jgi:hypothetical protein